MAPGTSIRPLRAWTPIALGPWLVPPFESVSYVHCISLSCNSLQIGRSRAVTDCNYLPNAWPTSIDRSSTAIVPPIKPKRTPWVSFLRVFVSFSWCIICASSKTAILEITSLGHSSMVLWEISSQTKHPLARCLALSVHSLRIPNSPTPASDRRVSNKCHTPWRVHAKLIHEGNPFTFLDLTFLFSNKRHNSEMPAYETSFKHWSWIIYKADQGSKVLSKGTSLNSESHWTRLPDGRRKEMLSAASGSTRRVGSFRPRQLAQQNTPIELHTLSSALVRLFVPFLIYGKLPLWWTRPC